MARLSGVLLLAFALDSLGQAVTSPPPANVMFVPNPYGYYFSRHPSLPVLYVGGYYAPESKNLITYPLNPDGTVNTNGMRSFNFFTRTGTNDLERYSLARPIVLPEERVLYLGVIPSAATYLTSDTNNQEIAAVSLDDAGQPVKVLKAIRTSHSEKEIRGWEFDPSTRRLYLSFHTYFGWLPVNREGLPESDKFNLILYIQTCWQWAYLPEWKRFYARQTDSGVLVFKLAPDGTALEVVQYLSGPYRGVGNLTVNPSLRRLYFLDTSGGRLIIHRLAKDGRITGLPRSVPLGEAYGVRFDFKTKSLYAWYDKAILRRFSLDDNGDPVGHPQLHALNCGGIRDMLVDEATGKLYVLCTEPPTPPK
jgi:hypothetical protein